VTIFGSLIIFDENILLNLDTDFLIWCIFPEREDPLKLVVAEDYVVVILVDQYDTLRHV
jgi:hypothetical protein